MRMLRHSTYPRVPGSVSIHKLRTAPLWYGEAFCSNGKWEPFALMVNPSHKFAQWNSPVDLKSDDVVGADVMIAAVSYPRLGVDDNDADVVDERRRGRIHRICQVRTHYV